MTRSRVLVLFFLTSSLICLAQTKEPSDAWLMQNYRFARPPAPGEIKPVSPMMSQLQDIQNTVLSIMRISDFEGDYEAALAAAYQATANAQLLGAISGELKPPPPPQPPAITPGASREEVPIYLIAFKDDTIQAVRSIWTDKLMAHYVTCNGAHEQVRLDRVDWKRSGELNRSLGRVPGDAQPLSAVAQ
jgi:hypothetical protein